MDMQVTGAVLAGGQARRMDGVDKGLIDINGKSMVEYVLAVLAPQVSSLLINANRNLEQYRSFGYTVIADTLPGFHGPLAGMASCMEHASTEFIITAPCDSPNIPGDYVTRMQLDLKSASADISVATDGERLQPVFSLIRTTLLGSLLEYLQSGERKIDKWFASQNMVTCDFSDMPSVFTNINTPADIAGFSETSCRGN